MDVYKIIKERTVQELESEVIFQIKLLDAKTIGGPFTDGEYFYQAIGK